MPFSRPTKLPRWASVAGTVAEPSGSLKDNGYVAGAVPTVAVHNYQGKNVYEWVAYLDEQSSSHNLSIVRSQTANWSSDSVATSSDSIYDFDFADDIYVAAGEETSGTGCGIFVSYDGVTWSDESKATTPLGRGVVHDSTIGLWAIVGRQDGTALVLTASDPFSTWTRQTTPAVAEDLNTITSNGTGLFVAVGDADVTDAYIVTSSNGTSWTRRTSGVSADLVDCVYGSSLFVAVGTDSVVTSPDGTTWTSRTIASGSWKSVTWNGSVFVAFATTDTATSPDGITWTSRGEAGSGHGAADPINGIITLIKDSPNGAVYVSVDDGITYAKTGRLAAQDGTIWGSVRGMNYAGDRFMVGDSGGQIASSNRR